MLYFLLKKNGKLTIENIDKIIEDDCDLLKIMCLDIIFNNYRIYGFNSSEEFVTEVKSVYKLYDKINSSDMKSEHWLLTYTVAINNWKVKNMDFTKINSDPYYKLFNKQDIHFYKSFFKEDGND